MAVSSVGSQATRQQTVDREVVQQFQVLINLLLVVALLARGLYVSPAMKRDIRVPSAPR